MKRSSGKLEIGNVRARISELCREMSALLVLVNERLSADSSFVFTQQYREMKRDLRRKNEELQQLKTARAQLQHCYKMVIKGDYVMNGRVLRDHQVDYELTSAIDCNLGSSTSLNNTLGSHKALWNLICAKVGTLFLHKRVFVDYIVQLR